MNTYFDHAATTPVRPQVAASYADLVLRVGNPASLHADGRAARRILEESREALAADLGAHPSEVIFTSGGTEADNLAIKGIYYAATAADPRRRRLSVSAIEHHAVLDAAHWLAERAGADLHLAGVDDQGRLDLSALEDHLAAATHGAETALVSVMWANNEVGTIQPLAEVIAAAERHAIAVHSDAVQAVGRVPVDFATSGLSALSMSGHKVGAPVGIGALLARRDLGITPVLHGGGQERDVRSGTVPVAAAAALAQAVHLAVSEREAEARRLDMLADSVIAGIGEHVPGVRLLGPAPGAGRLPGHLLFAVEGADAEAVLFGLDAAGISAASGAACLAGVNQPSHVLEAMGHDEAGARSGLRLTLGHTSTAEDVTALLRVLPEVAARARAAFTPRRSAVRPAPGAAGESTTPGGPSARTGSRTPSPLSGSRAPSAPPAVAGGVR